MTSRKLYTGEPDYTVCPGSMIRESLESQDMSQKDFAARMGLTEKHVVDILKGKTHITEEMATRLERVVGTPARIWSQLESQYRRDLIRLAQNEESEELDSWLKNIPYLEIKKRGFPLPSKREKFELRDSLLRFYGVASIPAWRQVYDEPVYSFRKSAKVSNPARQVGAASAWLRLCELEAGRVECKKYVQSQFEDAIREIRQLTGEAPESFVPRMQELCRNAGVALVFVPEFPGGHINGAMKWMNVDKVLLSVNLRGKRMDSFWFTFFHEVGHILLGNRSGLHIDFNGDSEGRTQKEEDIADQYASRILIPTEFEERLAALVDADFSEVEKLAEELHLHPGCIVGRLMNDGLIPWTHPWQKFRGNLNWENFDGV